MSRTNPPLAEDDTVSGVRIVAPDRDAPYLRYRQEILRVLRSLPPEVLAGLGSVVLRSSSTFPHRERRAKVRTARDLERLVDLGSAYVPARGAEPARIELYLHRIRASCPPWFHRVPFLRYETVHAAFFRELGRHVTTCPSVSWAEGAGEAARTLKRNSMRRRHPFLWPVLKSFVRLLRWRETLAGDPADRRPPR